MLVQRQQGVNTKAEVGKLKWAGVKVQGHLGYGEMQEVRDFLYDILHTFGQNPALDPFLLQFVPGWPPWGPG